MKGFIFKMKMETYFFYQHHFQKTFLYKFILSLSFLNLIQMLLQIQITIIYKWKCVGQFNPKDENVSSDGYIFND